MRNKILFASLGFLALVLLWYFTLFSPNQKRISDVRAQQVTVAQQIEDLKVRLVQLQQLQANEPQLRADLARFEDALPEDPRLPDFILQVQDQANLSGIEFLAITPSLPSPFGAAPAGPNQLQAISVSLSTTGEYFELLDFILRLERQIPRAVRLNTFSFAPQSAPSVGVSPKLAVTFQLQMFVIAPAAAAPAVPVAPVPAPGQTPLPGGAPVPAVTPAPVANPGGG